MYLKRGIKKILKEGSDKEKLSSYKFLYGVDRAVKNVAFVTHYKFVKACESHSF